MWLWQYHYPQCVVRVHHRRPRAKGSGAEQQRRNASTGGGRNARRGVIVEVGTGLGLAAHVPDKSILNDRMVLRAHRCLIKYGVHGHEQCKLCGRRVKYPKLKELPRRTCLVMPTQSASFGDIKKCDCAKVSPRTSDVVLTYRAVPSADLDD